MKKFIYWLLPFLLLWGSQAARASHIAAADISYRCIGNDRYEITLRLFRDCQGIGTTTQEWVDIQGLGSCSNASMRNVVLNKVSTQIIPLSCGSTTSCHGGVNPGFERVVYSGTVDLSAYNAPNCGWYVSYNTCCRSGSITNLTTTSSIYVEANYFPNSVAIFNSSPAVTSDAIFIVCNNDLQNISSIMTDPDGDSLSYALGPPLQGRNNPVPNAAGTSYTQPLLTTSAGYQFDATTAQSVFTPNAGTQVCLVNVVVSEYRAGV